MLLTNDEMYTFLDGVSLGAIRSNVDFPEESLDCQTRPFRVIIIGPGGSGKDTLAACLSKYVMLDNEYLSFNGSTSLAMLPYIYSVAKKLGLEGVSELDFYNSRSKCRIFWYNVILVYRDYNPSFMINQIDADIFVGSRCLDEIRTAVNASEDVVFVVCEGDGTPDPTWMYTTQQVYSYLWKEYGSKGIAYFQYSPDKFMLTYSVLDVAQEIGSCFNKEVQIEKRDVLMERNGVDFGCVIKGRFE